MPGRLLLSRAASIALRALVELAREPGVTLSVAELARRQQLPQPMLEQILLRLRRAGLVRARRGRLGGYRLVERAEILPLERVLRAVEDPAGRSGAAGRVLDPAHPPGWLAPGRGADTGDHGSSAPSQAGDGAARPAASGTTMAQASEPERLEASAGQRVEQQLRLRLERLVELELQRLTLAELLYDQRSLEASLGPEGGVMLS
jgi:Rrf2 family iron-sulfur cluster assembly transcriptional regulator